MWTCKISQIGCGVYDMRGAGTFGFHFGNVNKQVHAMIEL